VDSLVVDGEDTITIIMVIITIADGNGK